MMDKKIVIEARELRLWRDTLEGEVIALDQGEEPFLADRSIGGVSFLDRVVASIESHLISHDADWPKEE
jgi:hypothetical protein